MVTVTVNVCDSEGATTTQSMPVPVLALNAALISDAPSRPDPSAWCRGHGWALRKSIHHIVKALGSKITQVSPTRGYAMELGAAITIILASQFGLPVSTTQCLTGGVLGVALMNFDLGAVNWRQLAWIFGGWVLILPAAGLISGLLTAMALNLPQLKGT